jgi:D-tyrosyl-tRNA(Tyr) deacylase
MRALLQRVNRGRVSVDGHTIAEIGAGMVILLGVGKGDDEEKARALAEKIAFLRIFEDNEGKTNLSILDTGGAAIVVSQFTLYADTHKGRRPSFIEHWSNASPSSWKSRGFPPNVASSEP